MTTFDFSPLYRTSVGFDRLASMLSAANRPEQGNAYPPYNIIARSEDEYLSLIHISEPTRRRGISYAVFCLKKKK